MVLDVQVLWSFGFSQIKQDYLKLINNVQFHHNFYV